MDWASIIGMVGGLIGIVLGILALIDRSVAMRRGGVRHVTGRTEARNPFGHSDRGLDIIVSNEGVLPVTINEVRLAPPPRAKEFSALDGQRYRVAELEPIGLPVAPISFQVDLASVDRWVIPGHSFTIRIDDWTASGVPTGVDEATAYLQQRYLNLLSPLPSSFEQVGALFRPTVQETDRMAAWVKLTDYNGITWWKVHRTYRRIRGKPGLLRRFHDYWAARIERWSLFNWLEPTLMSWAVSGAAKGPRRGRIRAWIVHALVDWRVGPGVDLHLYPYLPRLWKWQGLGEMAVDPSRMRSRAQAARRVYRAERERLGRRPTTPEFDAAFTENGRDDAADI